MTEGNNQRTINFIHHYQNCDLDGAKIGIFYTNAVFRNKKTGWFILEPTCHISYQLIY